MAVAVLTSSTRSGVTSPMIRPASAGPRNGFRFDLVAEGLLWVDADLFEDVVLPFDPGLGFVDVGQDGAV
jgi:hypothetical protein